MYQKDSRIDSGRPFDWGRTSADYARSRDIYPRVFYNKIADRSLCVSGQNVLDIGTGTGVLARNMYRFGAKWTGEDISFEQIEQAKRLTAEADMDITFRVASAESTDHPPETFDAVTACQCFWYFDHSRVVPVLAKIIKPGGRLIVLQMSWLPFEDEIAAMSEKLVLKYNPSWSGAGETRHPVYLPDIVFDYFDIEYREEYDLKVPFTRESWHDRMKTCRGIGASLTDNEIQAWEEEHKAMLASMAPERFEVSHYAAMAILKP
ncbi:MAG: class I SAM-dependent methyltransferase, partial [Lachnospiraceae bacterium]|nr:class I SAM-dependent methyltransferase [Lachnospiraceae bacterium]